MTIALTGKMSGTADKHTADSLKASFENAWFAAARGAFEGKLSDAPENLPAAPILLFAHGSSGIGAPLKAFARFVSSLGWSAMPWRVRAKGALPPRASRLPKAAGNPAAFSFPGPRKTTTTSSPTRRISPTMFRC